MKKLTVLVFGVVIMALVSIEASVSRERFGLRSGDFHFSYGNRHGHQKNRHFQHGYRTHGNRQGYIKKKPNAHYRQNKRPRVFRKTYNNHRHGYLNRPDRGCGPVFKFTYDQFGNPRKIGGTLCYNTYGEGYIVPGSRYPVR